MKKIKLLLLALLIFPAFISYADIISPRHPLKVYIKVDNTEVFTDIVIVGVGDCPTFSNKPLINIITSDSRIELRKSCPIKFYAVKKDYLEEKGLNNIKWEEDKNVAKINEPISLEKGALSYNSNDRLEIHFTIAGFNNKEMIIYRSSQVYKYGNAQRPDKVENFELEGDHSELKNNF
ncbi:MAG: hypothetical protein LBV43_07350 [Prevotella sp.]|jgi:hypothetical protein|nr:hypothetical protein [Prevotella sp.]